MLAKVADFYDSHKLLVFFTPFFLYWLNGREISSGDPTPTVFTAINLIKHGTIFLDDLQEYIPYHNLPYYISQQGGHLVSNYPLFPGIMAAPIFAPFIWLGMINPGDGDLVWKYLAKLSGAAFTALSVGFMYLTLRRLIDKSGAWALATAYGLGTALWPVASQSLWQHGPGVLWWSIAFYAGLRAVEYSEITPSDDLKAQKICRRKVRLFLLLAGWSVGCTVLCRTVNGIGMMVLIAAVAYHFRWKSFYFNVPALMLLGALLGYNYTVFQTWDGGYTVLYSHRWNLDHVSGGSWSTPLLVGLSGHLISPSRGFLIFSPFLGWSLWGMIQIWKSSDRRARFLAWCIPAPLLMLMVLSKYAVWWGGNSHFGPRYPIEIYPFLILYLAFVWPAIQKHRCLQILFTLLLAYSMFVQWIGAFCYPSDWAVKPIPLWDDQGRLWDWRYNEIWTCLKHGIHWPL